MRAERKITTLAVTGGIGSGKSAVCSFFGEKGIPVYDSDSRTKVLYDSSLTLAASLKAAFGENIYREGKLDRAALAEMVFSDVEKLSKLESMVHPAVKEDFENWKASHEGRNIPFVIMESAIILDRPLFRDTADMVLVVEARIGRTERRDGTDREKVMARISAQKAPDSAKADFILTNDGDLEDLRRKVYELYDIICKRIQKL